jgi:dipeptidase E
MKRIILTSTGTTSETAKNAVLNLIPKLPNKNAVIITTASKNKENNKWNIITKDQFIEMGYEKIDFLDLETNPNINLSEYGTIYVAGGNTFKLMKFVGESNFKEEVEKCLEKGGVYIGSSAGAIIATPTIQIAGEITPDENAVNLQDLTGMNLVKFEILPHYEQENNKELEDYQKKTEREIKLISNEEIIVIYENN